MTDRRPVPSEVEVTTPDEYRALADRRPSPWWRTNSTLGVAWDEDVDAALRGAADRMERQEAERRAVDEDVRVAFMHLEEVILSLPGRWNDPLVPAECADALRAGYASLNAATPSGETP